MTLHKLVPLFVLALNILLIGSALASDHKNARNRHFAYLMCAMSLWTLGVLGLRWTDQPAAALNWERLVHLGVITIPILFYEYALLFTGDTGRSRALLTGYAVCALFLLVLPTRAFMTGVRETPWGFAPASGPLYIPFLAYFVAYLALGVAHLVRAHRLITSKFWRNRLRLVIVGVVAGILGGVIDFARFVFDLERLYPPGLPANAVFALALGVAIVRYRLMDLSAVAKRVVLYALTWLVLLPPLLVGVDILADVLPGWLVVGPGGSNLHTAIVLLGGLAVALPVMRKMENLLDHLMFRRQRAMRDALVALSKELAETLDVDRLAHTLAEGLTTRIPVVHTALYVMQPGTDIFVPLARRVADNAGDLPPDGGPLPADVTQWLRLVRNALVVDELAFDARPDGPGRRLIETLIAQRIAIMLPLFADGDVAAILVVGDKLSGEAFSAGEIEFLEVLGGQAATALKNARLYADLKAQMQELRATRFLYGQARDADRAKDQFLAILAHELRNPLAPILNAAQLLERLGDSDRRIAEYSAIVRRQGQHLRRLVDDLLDVSRIRSGKVRITREPVDLTRVLARCLETLQTSGKCHGREMPLVSAATPLIVQGDAVRLEQVLWNLLDNALKYSPPDTRILVSAAADGPDAVVRIKDEGVGIAPDVLPSIFDLFTQADRSLHRAGGGLGVGLALVRSLVAQHGGTVTAYSEGVGKGSEFVIRMPLAPNAVIADTGTRSPSAGGATSARLVLVVEDNADARRTLCALLEGAGHRVLCAEDGVAAFDAARAYAPDVAIIDIGLPGLDGYEVARRLRGTAVGQAMTLVAVTGYGQPEDRRQALESGFDAHLVKPVNPDELQRLIAAGRTIGSAPK